MEQKNISPLPFIDGHPLGGGCELEKNFRLSTPVHGPRATWFTWEGIRLLAIENERIRLVVWPDHGADLIEFRDKASDLDVLWKNPQCWPPRPHAVDQPHAGRSEFYDGFHGGWFVSVPNGFFPADYFGASVGCHGDLQNSPWTAEILRQDDNEVRVRCVGRGARTPWRIEREYVLRKDASQVDWHECLSNRSDLRLPVAWLHHPGFGGPIIEGAQILTSARQMTVPSATRPELSQLKPGYAGEWPLAPEQEGESWRDCSVAPARGSRLEHVVHMQDFPWGWGAIWNETRQLGFGLRWDEKIFPYAWSWAAGRGGAGYPLWGSCHTLTIQPSTSPLLPFEQLVELNQVAWVDAGASIQTSLSVGFIRDRNEVLEFSVPTSSS